MVDLNTVHSSLQIQSRSYIIVMKTMISTFLILFLFLASSAYAQELVIHCIDVGQGDCTLIESPSGKKMMVDNGKNSYSDELLVYLNSINVNHVDWMVATHYHSDHIGATNALVQQGIQIDSVFDRGWNYCTQTYNTYASVIGSVRHTSEDDRVFDFGDGVTARVVSVNGNGLLNEPFISDNCSGGGSNDENDFSVALVVSYGNFDFFVAGDLSGSNTGSYTDIETSVAPEVGEIEVYRVNHHGSNYSSNQYFIDIIDPEVSVISVGNNSYSHPHPTIVQRLLATSVIYQTGDENGNVVDGDIVIRTTGAFNYTVNGDTFDLETTGIMPDKGANIPKSFILYGNYPNPFNASTTIKYGLPKAENVRIEIYDLLGRRIRTLANEIRQEGTHEITFNADELKSGVYFYRFQAGNVVETKRMVLLK